MKINPPIRNSTWATDLQGQTFWFPVRKSGDDGQEFISLAEWSANAAHAEIRGIQTNEACGPHYGTTNPVVRVAQIKIIAVENL